MIRVLVVDDSKMHLAAVRAILEHAEGFEVVGIAEDGEQGLAKTHELKPTVVLMDVNMPRLDGLQATERIMAERPTPILLMTAAENLEKDVQMGMRALDRGALDLVPKPRDLDPRGPGAKKLVDRLRLIAGVPVISHVRWRSQARRTGTTTDAQTRKATSALLKRARKVIAIGASTGGPRALRAVLAALPAKLNAAVVIVQHIDGAFVEGLVRWLGDGLPLSVMIAANDQGLHDGEVLIAPSGLHLEITRDRRTRLVQAPPDGGHCPSANRLLASVGQVYGSNAIGVVLTGMGEDGARGLLEIRERGGMTIAQDEASSVVYGMPRAARELGAAREVLPLPRVAEAIGQALDA